MATVTAQNRLAGNASAQAVTGEARTEEDNDHGLPRFFYAATLALILSAVQGVVQRLPGISDWLRDADYGGHMVTNLAHTHITIVGAGTISLTGLVYYVLPRVTRRPLFSKSLTNVSFWATCAGVFGFYIAMLAIGIYEGMMVHAGWPYEAARDYLGAWHKAPMAITAAIMGIGYWTFVTNVYVTVGHASGERRINPAAGATDSEFLLAKFFVVGATGLLFGTVQGVYQVMPWSLDWLHATGDAGHLIDPMAHAHMNLVGGVSVALMGLLYFFIPKLIGRPMYSLKLGKFSFWFIVVGVFGFYLTAVTLGFIEGSMMLNQGISDKAAKAALGIWHPLPLAVAASIMGIGFWSFIANILLTLRRKPAEEAPTDRRLVFFLGVAAVSLLLGTIQGVIQILGPVEDWLEDALPSSYFVTPLAHAQLNMVGFAIVSLLTMSFFLLPRILGRPVEDARSGRRALTVIAAGIAASYLVFLGVGLAESIAIHNGVSPVEARDVVGGPWGQYILFVLAQGLLGVGYIMAFRHVSRVIGRDTIRAYFRSFRARMRGAGRLAVQVHPRALPADPASAQRRAITAFLFEALGGGLGFMGMGWIFSGRPFIGVMVLGSWGGGFWTLTYVIFAVAGGDQLLGLLLVPYLTIPLLSGIACYRTYMRDAMAHVTGRSRLS